MWQPRAPSTQTRPLTTSARAFAACLVASPTLVHPAPFPAQALPQTAPRTSTVAEAADWHHARRRRRPSPLQRTSILRRHHTHTHTRHRATPHPCAAAPSPARHHEAPGLFPHAVPELPARRHHVPPVQPNPARAGGAGRPALPRGRCACAGDAAGNERAQRAGGGTRGSGADRACHVSGDGLAHGQARVVHACMRTCGRRRRPHAHGVGQSAHASTPAALAWPWPRTQHARAGAVLTWFALATLCTPPPTRRGVCVVVCAPAGVPRAATTWPWTRSQKVRACTCARGAVSTDAHAHALPLPHVRSRRPAQRCALASTRHDWARRVLTAITRARTRTRTTGLRCSQLPAARDSRGDARQERQRTRQAGVRHPQDVHVGPPQRVHQR